VRFPFASFGVNERYRDLSKVTVAEREKPKDTRREMRNYGVISNTTPRLFLPPAMVVP